MPSSSDAPLPTAVSYETANTFFGRGSPTFIAGTSGDDAADRAIRGQIELIRALFFPNAKVLSDVDVGDAWPERPVVYGGPHVNALMRRVAAALPFTLERGRLALGEVTLAGDDFQLVTVVPADGARPELLLYAGTGVPGIAEINAGARGADAIVVNDAFGILYKGRWVRDGAGRVLPELSEPAPRIAWREVPGADVRLRFPAPLAPDPSDPDGAALAAAATRALAHARAQLGVPAGAPIALYVYPDARSKRSLTGDGGDGHAVPHARALHVVGRTNEPAALEPLIAHEATHILTWDHFGAPGSPLFGEGVAVWAAGRYAGQTLATWRATLRRSPRRTVRDLLGRAFRDEREDAVYPLAGVLVEVALAKVGRDAFFAHLFPATAATWDAACAAAGTTADALEKALDASLFEGPTTP